MAETSFLPEKEVAPLAGLVSLIFRNYRQLQIGPPYVRTSRRCVRYFSLYLKIGTMISDRVAPKAVRCATVLSGGPPSSESTKTRREDDPEELPSFPVQSSAAVAERDRLSPGESREAGRRLVDEDFADKGDMGGHGVGIIGWKGGSSRLRKPQ